MEHKMNATYQELLSDLPSTPCQNNEFIELNKYAMCSMYGSHIMAIPYHLSAVDYDFFWGCMKIYDAFGINYFDRYLKFISGYYGDFSHGLENWSTYMVSGRDIRFHSNPGEIAFSMYCEYLDELCDCMKFFGFGSYNNLSLAELEAMLKDAPEHNQVLQNKIKQKNIVKSELAIEDKIKHFFNLGDFSEKAFSAHVEACTTKHKNGGDISIDDAIMLAQSAPMAMYIVTLSRAGEVFFAGKTTNLLAYLGKYSRQHEADSASFEAVDEEYAADVLLATMIYFDLPLDTVRITRSNRKYTTLKQACFVYSRAENIRRKTILNVIRTHKFRTIELPYGDIVLDKIALERALHC